MSGIVAHFSADGEDTDLPLVGRLASRLSHRGPDGQGHAVMGRASVAHTRLAIVDLANGQQPMRGEAFGSLMVCNGDIFNHRALRKKLLSEHSFKSQSDSEVVLHLYEELGSECAARLDGTFAFFVSDGEAFVAARDPLGVKPLYYGRSQGGGFVFASELKAIAGACRTSQQLPPGCLITQNGRVKRWSRPKWETQVGFDRGATPRKLARRLEEAVVKRLMSDVPLGVFLSGGLDSSIVAELAMRHYPPLKTFSVGLDGAGELDAARLVASHIGSEHFESSYTPAEATGALRDIIYHLESYDLELIRAAIPQYFLSKLAAQHVKTVLTGDGADELFGGNPHFSRISEPAELHRECVRLLQELHAGTLQRVDRMAMAHGLEARVPFLDDGFVAIAMRTHPQLKRWRSPQMGKQLLREAFQDRLPPEILARVKNAPSSSSASVHFLTAYAEAKISDADLRQAARRFPLDTPRLKEALLYRDIFDALFPGEAWRASIPRWHAVSGSGAPARGFN